MKPETRIVYQNMINRHKKEKQTYNMKLLLARNIYFDVSNCVAFIVKGYLSVSDNKETHTFTNSIFILASDIYVEHCQKTLSIDQAIQKCFNLGVVIAKDDRSVKTIKGMRVIDAMA